jgi:2-C-methyl-D-erythritol 4-phosphate cytidylyltransferase
LERGNSKYKYSVIIPAAGSGSRLGTNLPKALVPVAGKTILERSISLFLNNPSVCKIIVPVPRGNLNDLQNKSEDWFGEESGKVSFITGGSTRQESVKLALLELERLEFSLNNYVLVHDAARCLLSQNLIELVMKEVVEYNAVTVGLLSVDSLKEVDSNKKIVKSLIRENVWQVQTPQAFRFDILLKAHKQAEHLNYSDDASLVEQNQSVHIVQGQKSNIKITYKEDLDYAIYYYNRQS